MKQSIVKSSLLCVGMLLAGSAFSANLATVYTQALSSDPSFKQADAAWQLAKAQVTVAEGANFVLPTVNLALSTTFTHDSQNTARVDSQARALTLNVSQTLFNLSAWESVESAGTQVKAAFASYNAAAQTLLYNTANVYFTVLKDSDTLRFDRAEKRALYRQLETNRQKYRVGLIAITGVYEAQSKYDNVLATEITDKNQLENDLENLRAITGVYYTSLKGLKGQVPLVTPNPVSILAWVKMTQQQNYVIKADRLTMLSYQQSIHASEAARLPTLQLNGSVTRSSNEATVPAAESHAVSAGLTLNFPLFKSAAIVGGLETAQANYANASAQYELDFRAQSNAARKAYLGVMSGISKIKADQQAIKSARKALAATKAGYVVGTRTMVNVLDDMSTLYQVQKQYADDEYGYIMHIISLKRAAGTLGLADIKTINSWLSDPVPMVSVVPKAVVVSTQAKTATVKPSTQLGSVASTAYVLQFYASHTMKHAKQFIQKNQSLNIKLRVIQQGAWYKVVSIAYPTLLAARKGRSALPAQLKALHPWVTRG